MSTTFDLPPVVKELTAARKRLQDHYGHVGLPFRFDGNLVGNIGEAIAAELFGIRLTPPNGTGIDGHTPDGRSVQIKASGCGRGPAFRRTETRADHLLFFLLDFDACTGTVAFNGPEHLVLALFPNSWVKDQRSASLSRVLEADRSVPVEARLPRLSQDGLVV